jgi:hypothetical protein
LALSTDRLGQNQPFKSEETRRIPHKVLCQERDGREEKIGLQLQVLAFNIRDTTRRILRADDSSTTQQSGGGIEEQTDNERMVPNGHQYCGRRTDSAIQLYNSAGRQNNGDPQNTGRNMESLGNRGARRGNHGRHFRCEDQPTIYMTTSTTRIHEYTRINEYITKLHTTTSDKPHTVLRKALHR